MTRFSADWHARREIDVAARENADMNANCEFVDITGMGVSRIPAPESRSVGSASRKPAEVSSTLDRPASAASYPLVRLCRAHGLVEPIPEFRFHPERKWRFDYAWPQQKVFVEIEGGLFIQGRHNRGAGMRADFEKYNAASLLGWRGYHYLPEQINSRAIADLRIEFAR